MTPPSHRQAPREVFHSDEREQLHSFVQSTVSEHLSHWCKMGRQWEGWEQSNEKLDLFYIETNASLGLLVLMSETATRCFCFFPLLSSDVSF